MKKITYVLPGILLAVMVISVMLVISISQIIPNTDKLE